MSKVIGIRELGRNPSEVIDSLERNQQPIVIARNGKPTAVLVPLSSISFEGWVHHEIAHTISTRPTARYRPAAIPIREDFRRRRLFKSVELPNYLEWSSNRVFDTTNIRERARLYEVVLREGTAEDIAAYVEFGDLLKCWSEMFLPGHIREAWEERFPMLSSP